MLIPIGGDNAFYLSLYARYVQDPSSVPADWVAYFEEMRGGSAKAGNGRASSGHAIGDYLDAARRLGHLAAELDPLGLAVRGVGLLDALRDAALAGDGNAPSTIAIGGEPRDATVTELVAKIDAVYRATIGIEADHLPDAAQAEWLFEAFERAMLEEPVAGLLETALESVALADTFESFMRVKFPTKKRFGSEGSEGSVVFLREVFRMAAETPVEEIVMGGMHRGRLAVLAVALGKSPATLAAELTGQDLSEGATFTGDVPYHLGYRTELDIGARPGKRGLGVTLLPHPSHLMVVAPVAFGMARAAGREGSADGGDALCLLMHTDAAFAGQGLTSELMQLGGLPGYDAGGAIHLVVNNQIGFTTLPSEGRSSRYCTDIGKMTGIPILHVNGDDAVAVAKAARLAVAWRGRFRRDILIDMVCYRRFGHNELDEPRFTQPAMWHAIDRHPPLYDALLARMQAANPALAESTLRVAETFSRTLQDGFERFSDLTSNYQPIQSELWGEVEAATEDALLRPVATGRVLGDLQRIGIAASTIAMDGEINPKVRRFYEQRLGSIEAGRDINFATAEALAFATLLDEGHSIRISGQDVVRGTFTQRHMAVHRTDGMISLPVEASAHDGARFEIINSPLSEYGVLSFEYGHSLFDPRALTIWEAQFGDFLNGAQSIVDQYIVSGEAKWHLRTGLIVQLPHGLEGQGPDHSSARIERLLQMCAGGNIVVANPSTPANLFHLLRRQIHAPWRKPLFLIAPKSLLRARAAVSDLAEMDAGTAFAPVLGERLADRESLRRIVLCSGKIAYALEQARDEAGLADEIGIVRIEQLYPLDVAALRAALADCVAAETVWLQEEAENQGPWPFLSNEFRRHGLELDARRPVYARPAMPVTAGGSVERHEREEAALLRAVLAP